MPNVGGAGVNALDFEEQCRVKVAGNDHRLVPTFNFVKEDDKLRLENLRDCFIFFLGIRYSQWVRINVDW